MLSGILQPTCQVVKSITTGDVIDKKGTSGATVVGSSDASEGFLPSLHDKGRKYEKIFFAQYPKFEALQSTGQKGTEERRREENSNDVGKKGGKRRLKHAINTLPSIEMFFVPNSTPIVRS